jgi:hypothetical protein
MKLFIDDVRNPEPGDSEWVTIRNYENAISIIFACWSEITHISLDHDLGEEKTGYDIVCFIEKYLGKREHLPAIKSHSAYPVGREKIHAVVAKLEWR